MYRRIYIILLLVGLLGCYDSPIILRTPYTELQLVETVYPPAALGCFYSVQMRATGGWQPYTFEAIGGEFPPGLVCYPDGTISGYPNDDGRYEFFGFVGDLAGNYDAGRCTIVVSGNTPLTIISDRVNDGVLGVSYTTTIDYIGGTAPYSCCCQGLPLGLYVTSPGNIITGVPQEAGTFHITFQVQDWLTAIDIQKYTLTIYP